MARNVTPSLFEGRLIEEVCEGTVADLGLDRGWFQSEELEDVGARILSHAHFLSATPIHIFKASS